VVPVRYCPRIRNTSCALHKGLEYGVTKLGCGVAKLGCAVDKLGCGIAKLVPIRRGSGVWHS
jgi:hypothetical protein